MSKVRFFFQDGCLDVTAQSGKWTAEELKSRLEENNINSENADLKMEGEELVVVEHKTGNIRAKADEQATEEILADIAEKVTPIIADGLCVDESEIKEVELDGEYNFINFWYDDIDVSYNYYEPCYSTISAYGEITAGTIYRLSDFLDDESMREAIWEVLPC